MGLLDSIRDAGAAAAYAAGDVLSKAREEDEDIDSTSQGGGSASASGDTSGDAGQAPDGILDPTADPKALFWDPFAVIDALGYKDKPTSVSYATLQAMVWRMPILQTIIQTRLNQLSNFSEPQQDKFQTGYRIQLRDKKATPTKASEKRSQEMENWLRTTGKTENPRARDDFETFLRKVGRDALTYDQMCFEVREDKRGTPFDFYAVDGATIRIADTTKLQYTGAVDEVRYVQIYDGLVVAEYTADELCFGVRNATTDIRNQQYGRSEIEMLISTVTSLLWAWDYNQKFFSQGTSTKGIINFKGAVPERQLRSFRRHWYSMVAGVENAFKTPITNAEDLQYINLQQSNRDMEFSAWFDFLIKVASGMFGMDPMEINFKYGDSGGAKSMFESGNKQKLAQSKDKGLKPYLRFIANRINSYLIRPMDEDFEFAFVGLDAQSPQELADLNNKMVTTYKTVDEVRAEEDLPPLADGAGDVILNPVWMQNKTMAAQEAAGVGDFADEEEDEFGNELDGLNQDDEGGSPFDGGGNPFGGGDDGAPPGGAGKKDDKPAKPDEPAKAEKSMPRFASPDGLLLHSPTGVMATSNLIKGIATPPAATGTLSIDLDL